MKLCFFEDHFRPHFDPLTLTRPLDQLRVGILTLAEKWERTLNTENYPSSRVLQTHLKHNYPQPKISEKERGCWVNPRYLPDENLVEAILQLPTPKNVKEIEAFIGKVNYYGKFVPNFSDVVVGPAPDPRQATCRAVQPYRRVTELGFE